MVVRKILQILILQAMGLWLEGRTEAGPHILPCPKWERSSFQNFLFFRTFLFFLLPHWTDTPWGAVWGPLVADVHSLTRTGRSRGGSQGVWNKAGTLSIWQGRQEGRHLLLAPDLAKVLSVAYYDWCNLAPDFPSGFSNFSSPSRYCSGHAGLHAVPSHSSFFGSC